MGENTEFFRLSIEEARKSRSEGGRIQPKVGVVVARDGELLGKAHRGEFDPREHAEFTLLERKLKDATLADCTVFTTLEPCTERKPPKCACARHLIFRKVKKVFIGMLDPNPIITGRGQLALSSANIETELYPPEFMRQIEELNREFIQHHSRPDYKKQVDPSFITQNSSRPLDVWYEAVNRVYWNRNYYRDPSSIFTHLVEVVGGLSLLASSKQKQNVKPHEYVPKALAWWLALCGKMGVKSVEEMLWTKFPAVCAYCHKQPHDSESCLEVKSQHAGPQWGTLSALGKATDRPRSLGEWQRMFSSIYPAQQTDDFGKTFGRLCEELGELAEAIRVFSSQPGYFLSEACDVFAWLMHVQNLIELKLPRAGKGRALEESFCRRYPDFCLDCGVAPCACPPILPNTIGRTAHEVPLAGGAFNETGQFMTSEMVSRRFSTTA